MATCNLVTAYIMWLFGGILGLHHIYLNRPRHFFIWFVTWGGMVLGWISEVTRIKEYVDEANRTPEFKKHIKETRKANERPEISVGFLGFSMLIGHQLAKVSVNALPDAYIIDTWYGPYLAHALMAIGASVGVYLVANMGPQKAPFWLPLLAAICTSPASYFLVSNRPVVIVICVITSACVSSEYAEWEDKKRPKKNADFVKIWGVVVLGLMLHGTLWASNLYHNHRVNTLNGTRIPLREAAANFIRTWPIEEGEEEMWNIFPCLKQYPYDTCINHFVSRLTELSDPGKDAWALEILGFDKFPSEKEISTQCRKLSRKYHPDKVRTKEQEEQEEAQKMFIDIQKACSTLSKTKTKRERKSQWSENSQQETNTHNDDVTDDVIQDGDGEGGAMPEDVDYDDHLDLDEFEDDNDNADEVDTDNIQNDPNVSDDIADEETDIDGACDEPNTKDTCAGDSCAKGGR